MGGTNPGKLVLGGTRKEFNCDVEGEISIPAPNFFVEYLP